MRQITILICLSMSAEFITSNEKTCKFTRDCQQYWFCKNIQDASCKCNFGKCVTVSIPWFRPHNWVPECRAYKDCKCKSDPENCFCRGGSCIKGAWECHNDEACKRYDKCEDKQCTCKGNTCEHECFEDRDCAGQWCERWRDGYMCKCVNSLCDLVEKNEAGEKKCKSFIDCVQKRFKIQAAKRRFDKE